MYAGRGLLISWIVRIVHLIAAWAWLASSPAFAQTPAAAAGAITVKDAAAAVPQIEPRPAGGRPTVTAVRARERLVIDGQLDDAAWRTAG